MTRVPDLAIYPTQQDVLVRRCNVPGILILESPKVAGLNYKLADSKTFEHLNLTGGPKTICPALTVQENLSRPICPDHDVETMIVFSLMSPKAAIQVQTAEDVRNLSAQNRDDTSKEVLDKTSAYLLSLSVVTQQEYIQSVCSESNELKALLESKGIDLKQISELQVLIPEARYHYVKS